MLKKRIISLILAFSAVFSSVVFAWEPAGSSSDERAKEVLKALDIFDMLSSEGYKDEDILTRGELAEVVMRMTGVYDSAAFVNIFDDVTESTKYAKSITALAAMGIIAEGENFYPEEPALYEHAVKMIVYLLGYDVMVEYQGGWLAPIFSVASDVGLTKGISAGEGDKVNAKLMAALAFNALDCDMMERTVSNEFVTKQGVSLLNEKFDIYKIKGIMSANEKTSLTGAGAGINQTVIDGITYDDSKKAACDYLGMEIMAYYYDDNGDYDIVYAYPTNKNSSVTVKASQIEEDAAGFGYTNFYYTEQDNERLQRIKISENADVIYNGKAYPEYTDGTFKIESGSIRFIDNDDDSVADVIFVNESKTFVVDVVNGDEMQIYDMYGQYLMLKEAEYVSVYDMFGSPIGFNQIAKWNVLSVVQSLDGEFVEITAYDDPVIGDVQSVWDEDGETYVKIDGDTFAIAPSYKKAVAENNANAKKIMIGQTGTYYLDGDERIAAVALDSANSWNYGFLIKAYYDDSSEYSRFKILSDRSGAKFYDGAEAIRIDGYKKEGEEIYKALCIAGDGAENKIQSESNPDEFILSTVPQLIKFMMNGQGEISKIDTAKMTDKESRDNNLSKDVDRKQEYWSVRTGRLGTKESLGVCVNVNDTMIFQVPSGKDIYNEEKYSIRTTGLNFENNKSLLYDAYDVDFSGLAKVAVVYNAQDSEQINYDRMIMVTAAEMSAGNSGEVSTVIKGLDISGKTISYEVKDDVDVKAVSAGDLLSYKLDYQNKIEEIYMFFDREQDKDYEITARVFNSTGDYLPSYTANAQNYMTKNIIADKQGNYIKTMVPETVISSVVKSEINFSNSQTYALSDAVIYLYDSGSKFEKVRKITSAELEEYVHYRNKNARALIFATYSQLRAVYIYV